MKLFTKIRNLYTGLLPEDRVVVAVYVFTAVIAISLAVFGLSKAHASLPPQTQASTLAVPEQKPYASAIVISQCSEAVAVVLIDSQGSLHPQHLKDLSHIALLRLLNAAPADKITGITVACPTARSL